jgi:hypothetical protein
MATQPDPSPMSSTSMVRPCQIQPPQVWKTLIPQQQTMVLQVLVTMCQQCLLPTKEVIDDNPASFSENHANPLPA